MTCGDVRLEDRALGFLESGEAAEVDRHLGECAGCRAAMTRVRALLDRLEELPPGERNTEPLVRAVMRSAAPKPKRHWEGKIMLTAASLLLAGLIGVYVAQDPPKDAKKPAEAAKQDAPHAKEIDKLVERLGGNDVEDRDKAEKELVALANDIEHAIASLEKAKKSGDAELASRAGRAVKSLQDAIGKLGTPTPVAKKGRLSADDAARLLAEAEAKIKVKPADATGWSMQAEALLELGRAKEALAAATRSTELEPTSSAAWLLRGEAGLELEQPDDAVAAFTKAIEVDPQRVDAYFGRARASLSLKRYGEAMRDLDKAAVLDPSRVDIAALRDRLKKGEFSEPKRR